jgi:hypothetical protein
MSHSTGFIVYFPQAIAVVAINFAFTIALFAEHNLAVLPNVVPVTGLALAEAITTALRAAGHRWNLSVQEVRQ